MTCINCLHCEICDYWYDAAYSTEPEGWDGQICKYFKNKNNFIEVPCAIDQTLYYYDSYTRKLEEDQVKYFTITRAGVKPILCRHNIKFWDYYELGKNVFLTREEAEEKEKESFVNGY